ncbi:MAG: VCBS repeat-containing protein [Planctomycetota bacterium]|nr:VCBS repeat-containing protein [Planctomycetota bacterium]
MFTASGSVVTFERQVPSEDLGVNDQQDVEVVMAPDASFVMTWEEVISPSLQTVSYRRFGVNGTFVATEDSLLTGVRALGENYSLVGSIFDPQIALERNGTFVIVVTHNDSSPNATNLLYYEFSSSGAELVSAEIVHSGLNFSQRLGFVGKAGDNFTVAWTVTGNGADSFFARNFVGSVGVGRDGNDVVGYTPTQDELWVGYGKLGQSLLMDNQRLTRLSGAVTWVNVLTGDFDGNGTEEVVARVLESGEWWHTDGTTTTSWGYWSPLSWLDVKAADFTGDGRTDIAGRESTSGEWWVAVSNGTRFTNQKFTSWNPTLTWVDVQVGDFTGDGRADLAGRTSGQWWVARSTVTAFTNSFWGACSTAVSWLDVRVGDFNNDGRDDIAGRVSEWGQWWVARSAGSSFTNVAFGGWTPSVAWADVVVGDFDGDGRDDLAARVADQLWVARSTGSTFTTTFWGSWGSRQSPLYVGDFNRDGRQDLAGRDTATGIWWVGMSTTERFNSYFWGY